MPLGKAILIRGFCADLDRQDLRQVTRVAGTMLVETRRTVIAKGRRKNNFLEVPVVSL